MMDEEVSVAVYRVLGPARLVCSVPPAGSVGEVALGTPMSDGETASLSQGAHFLRPAMARVYGGLAWSAGAKAFECGGLACWTPAAASAAAGRQKGGFLRGGVKSMRR